MPDVSDLDLTQLLNLGAQGDIAARNRGYALVYAELRRTAAAQLGSGWESVTLSPTTLVNETYLKISAGAMLALQDRRHFFALSARAMRQLLIDHQRQKHAGKHGGQLARVELNEELGEQLTDPSGGPMDFIDHVDLDRALLALERIDERAARVVDMHSYAGLNFMEIAELLAISDKTVRRDWNTARAFLRLQMASPDEP